MIAANGVYGALSRATATSLRCAACCARPKRWDRIVALAAELGEALPAEPDAPRARRRSCARASRGAGSLRRPLAVGGQAPRPRRVRPRDARRARERALRSGGAGLHALDGAEPPLPRPDHAAPAQGGARRARRAVHDGGAGRARAHCTLQEDNAQKVERQVQKSAAALLLSSRIGERWTRIVTGASDKGTWVRIRRPRSKGSWSRVRGARRRRNASRASSSTPTSSAASSTSSAWTEGADRERRPRRPAGAAGRRVPRQRRRPSRADPLRVAGAVAPRPPRAGARCDRRVPRDDCVPRAPGARGIHLTGSCVMTKPKKKISLVGWVSLGTGVMIGGGIFALVGQVADIAGDWFRWHSSLAPSSLA